MGVVAEESGFRYEFESLAGDAECVLRGSQGDAHRRQDVVGDDDGRLVLSTQKGEVRLGPQGEFARRAEQSEQAQSLLWWAAGMDAFCFVMGWHWAGWGVMDFWFGGSRLALIHASTRKE